MRDAAGQPLEGILLEAETKTQPPASAFVISGADGSFKLTLAATPASDSLRLSARALGYAEQLLRLANHSQAHGQSQFRARQSPTALPSPSCWPTVTSASLAPKRPKRLSNGHRKGPGISLNPCK
ncbi:MAG: hypothetical protein ACRYF0_16160 [Janthinobacterium lividum]